MACAVQKPGVLTIIDECLRLIGDFATKSSSLSTVRYNICEEVRQCSLMVLSTGNETKQDVWIDEEAINREVRDNYSQYVEGHYSATEWRKEPYHYFNSEDTELTLQFILVLDALNFCFWPLDDYEYEHLGKGLRCTLEQNKNAFSAQSLMQITEDTLSQWLLSQFKKDEESELEIPLISERARLLREVGRTLHVEYGGSVLNLVESAGGSAVKLVETMSKQFRGFADHCICPWNGKQICFYKRAQIFVAEIYCAFQGQSVGQFADIDQLTCFADYRVPQLLRAMNILKYSKALSEKIDGKQVIAAGSREEILIRGAMIVAVERMKERLNVIRREKNERELMSIELDWYLWNRGEELNALQKLKPHHRTRTICY